MTETAREAHRRIKAELLETLSVAVTNIGPDLEDNERDGDIHERVVEEVAEELGNRARKLRLRVDQDQEAIAGMIAPDEHEAGYG